MRPNFKGWDFARLILIACAAAAFQGCSDIPRGGSDLASSYKSVHWYFQCPTQPFVIPPPTDSQSIVIEGAGPHRYRREDMVGTPVTVKGRVCPPVKMRRDIIFIIDVSWSMFENDKYDATNKTCGRFKALNAVLDKLPADSSFSVVTFDDVVQKTSSGLYDSKETLFYDLVGSGTATVEDIVCDAIGSTNYDAPLLAAKTLLQGGRRYGTKEIFFISDGEPSEGDDGIATATSLKTTGVTAQGQTTKATIATIMLGTGNDSILRTKIASIDTDGQPIHAKVDNAAGLEPILSRMADNKLIGSTLSHGPDRTPSASQTNLMPLLNNYDFELPPFTLRLDGQQREYVVNFEYWDSHQNRFLTHGVLGWAD